MGRPHLTWMDTAMYDMGSLGHMLQIDLPRYGANLALYRMLEACSSEWVAFIILASSLWELGECLGIWENKR